MRHHVLQPLGCRRKDNVVKSEILDIGHVGTKLGAGQEKSGVPIGMVHMRGLPVIGNQHEVKPQRLRLCPKLPQGAASVSLRTGIGVGVEVAGVHPVRGIQPGQESGIGVYHRVPVGVQSHIGVSYTGCHACRKGERFRLFARFHVFAEEFTRRRLQTIGVVAGDDQLSVDHAHRIAAGGQGLVYIFALPAVGVPDQDLPLPHRLTVGGKRQSGGQ